MLRRLLICYKQHTGKHQYRTGKSRKRNARFIRSEQSKMIDHQSGYDLPEVEYHHVASCSKLRNAYNIKRHDDDRTSAAQPYPRRMCRDLMHRNKQPVLTENNKGCEKQPCHGKIESRRDERRSEKPSCLCIYTGLHRRSDAGNNTYRDSQHFDFYLPIQLSSEGLSLKALSLEISSEEIYPFSAAAAITSSKLVRDTHSMPAAAIRSIPFFIP